MRKKTKNRHGGFGLQVLLLMLVMLVGGGSTAWAQSYITNLMILGCGTSKLDAKNLRNEYTNKGWTVLEQEQGFKIGRKPTQPGVYIHHGKKVLIKHITAHLKKVE